MVIGLPFIASFSLLAVLACVLIYWLWWVLPKRLSRNQPNDRTSRRLESLYRKNVSQALAGVSILAGILITIEQTVSTQRQATLTSQEATRTSIMQQHQKALELLSAPSQASHAGAVYTLQALRDEMPKLEKPILFELAGAAVLFSPRPALSRDDSQSAQARPTVTMDAQAALSVIGSLPEMKGGLPLPLAKGFFRGVSLPFAYLNGVQLQETDLSGSDLYGAQLYGANLRFARLSGANLAGAMLINAGFVGAVLCADVNVAVAHLETGKPVVVQLAGARLDHANLSEAWLVGADLGGATALQADFRGAHLMHVKFGKALLDEAGFQGADLTDADFSKASIRDIKIDANTTFCRTKWPGGSIRSEGCPPIGPPKDVSASELCPEPLVTRIR
jgi:hypothetical protein